MTYAPPLCDPGNVAYHEAVGGVMVSDPVFGVLVTQWQV